MVFQDEVYRLTGRVNAKARERAIDYFVVDTDMWRWKAPRESARACARLAQVFSDLTEGGANSQAGPAKLPVPGRSLPTRVPEALRRYVAARVRNLREEIFGAEAVPFSDDLQAARWIERQRKLQRRHYKEEGIAAPTKSAEYAEGLERAEAVLADLSHRTGVKHRVAVERPTLEYFRPSTGDSPGDDNMHEIAHVRVRMEPAGLAVLSAGSEVLSKLTGAAQSEVVRWILCGAEVSIRPFTMTAGEQLDRDVDGTRYVAPEVNIRLYEYPTARTWRRLRTMARRTWRMLMSDQAAWLHEEPVIDPLDDLVDARLEESGGRPRTSRAVRLRGGRVTEKDVALEAIMERLMAERGGFPGWRRGRLQLYADAASEMEREGYLPTTAEAARKRWGRLQKRQGGRQT